MASAKKIWCEGQLIEVSVEVYKADTQGERKERYISEDLKTERIQIDTAKQTIHIRPSREDSLERLMDENAQQFADNAEPMDEAVARKVLLEQALNKLTPDERAMIYALFFEELSEREYARRTGIAQKTINDRKNRILKKLKKLLE